MSRRLGIDGEELEKVDEGAPRGSRRVAGSEPFRAQLIFLQMAGYTAMYTERHRGNSLTHVMRQVIYFCYLKSNVQLLHRFACFAAS